MKTKTCARCSEIKPLEDFYTDNRKRDGRRSQCKDCHKVTVKERYDARPDFFKEYQVEYRLKNKDKILRVRRLRKYGLTEAEYDHILQRAKGR